MDPFGRYSDEGVSLSNIPVQSNGIVIELPVNMRSLVYVNPSKSVSVRRRYADWPQV